MYHSITFGDKNTWTDWHLVPSSRPVINPPKPKVQYVDIPGADGSIDLTESLAGRPVFSDREGSLDFIVLNDFNVDNYNYNWIEVYTEIMQYLHGQRMKMILEDDPNYYYDGRFEVNSWKSDQNNSTITIDYHLSPYKYEITSFLTADDLEIGSLSTIGTPGTSSFNILEEDGTRNMARLKAPPRPYSAGDTIRVLSRNFGIDVAMYGGTASNPIPKNFIWSAYMTGNGYTFTDSGFYRFNIHKSSYVAGEPVTQEDLIVFASVVNVYKGGVL